MSRSFYLVQRIHRSWRADGHLGDYDLDYMGAAEFEWGAIPEAFKRFQDAGKKLELVEFEYGGHTFDFLYRKKDGEPFEAWTRWAEGTEWAVHYGSPRPFYGCETPYELQQRLNGEKPWGGEWRTHVWWALNENVMWAFRDDGHLLRMLESLGATKDDVVLRG